MLPTTQAPLRADQRPLYAQASEALRTLVQCGEYAPGDRLPSEIELSQRLGISRPTLREALRHLEQEGSIVRRHGVGTFVAERMPVIEAGLEVLESIEQLASRCGLRVQMGEIVISERMTTAAESGRSGVGCPGAGHLRHARDSGRRETGGASDRCAAHAVSRRGRSWLRLSRLGVGHPVGARLAGLVSLSYRADLGSRGSQPGSRVTHSARRSAHEARSPVVFL